jgi:hypothetical protein
MNECYFEEGKKNNIAIGGLINKRRELESQ